MRQLTGSIACIASIFLALLPKNISRACGFYVAPGEYRFWLMQPNLTNEQDLTPFFFASTYLYKGDQFSARETYPQRNVEEWSNELKGKVPTKDIDTMLYHTDPQALFDGPEHWAKTNVFMQALEQPQNSELHRYFLLSKKVEQVIAHPDPWDEQGIPDRSFHELIREATELHSRAGSGFVRLRTAYQLEKLYAYSGQDHLVGGVYDKWISPVKTDSWIKLAALYQKAISIGGVEGQYLLSRVFDQGGYNRTYCLIKFKPQVLGEISKLAKNKHERNVLVAMAAFNSPGRCLEAISTIHHTEPGYQELPFLLLREVNKVEDWLATPKLTGFGMPAVYGQEGTYHDYLNTPALNHQRDEAYARQLLDLLERMIVEEKSQQKAQLCLFASHLSLLLHELPRASRYLDMAKKQEHTTGNVHTQVRINAFLLDLENGSGQRAERELMSILRSPDNELQLTDPGLMRDQLILYTGRKMIRQGDRAKGLMLLSRTRRALGELPIGDYKRVYQEIWESATGKDYDDMLDILGKSGKTAFERFLVEGPFKDPLQNDRNMPWWDYGDAEHWDRNKLLDGKASWYLRQHDLRNSLIVLRKIPDSFWRKWPYKEYIDGDAFYVNVYHASRYATDDKRKLNKRQIVEEMLRLEDIAAKQPSRAALCHFKLANAWYNMSYHGKSWLMVRQWWSVGDMMGMNAGFKKTAFHEDYYGCATARQYYQRALKESRDKELRALCYFMMEACARNKRMYEWSMSHDGGVWGFADHSRPDPATMKKLDVDVDLYRDLVRECELYQSFVRRYSQSN